MRKTALVSVILCAFFSSSCLSQLIKNSKGKTVRDAITEGNIVYFEAKFEEGYDPNHSIEIPDEDDRDWVYYDRAQSSPIRHAVEINNRELVKFLLENGADPKYLPPRCQELKLGKRMWVKPFGGGSNGYYHRCIDRSLLSIAVEKYIFGEGDILIIKLLLDAGIHPDTVDNHDRPIFIAASKASTKKEKEYERRKEIIVMMLEHGSDINGTVKWQQSGQRRSVLAIKGYVESGYGDDLAKFLVERRAVSICTEKGGECIAGPSFFEMVGFVAGVVGAAMSHSSPASGDSGGSSGGSSAAAEKSSSVGGASKGSSSSSASKESTDCPIGFPSRNDLSRVREGTYSVRCPNGKMAYAHKSPEDGKWVGDSNFGAFLSAGRRDSPEKALRFECRCDR